MAISLEHQIKELEMRKRALIHAIEYVFEGGDRTNNYFFSIRRTLHNEIDIIENIIKDLRIKGEPTEK